MRVQAQVRFRENWCSTIYPFQKSFNNPKIISMDVQIQTSDKDKNLIYDIEIFLMHSITLIHLFLLHLFRFVEESMRWLTANNKHEEDEKLIKRAATANGVDPASVLQLFRENTQTSLRPSLSSTQVTHSGTSIVNDCPRNEVRPFHVKCLDNYMINRK